ncbi:MAG TPA: NfeD family protein [Vicinamibacteria bacterium]|nr:NfeD family protein [Vicinamibacteria bacterium]
MALALPAPTPCLAAEAPPAAYVVPVHGMIDLGLAPFVQRALDEAAAENASVVILDINTFGGRVDAAVLIRDALLGTRVRTAAFVNRRAISAGALITLAAEKVAMTGGATVGAAAPVLAGPSGEMQPASEKSVSYMRKEFRATAESRHRPPLLAEAMVDADVEVPGVIEKGKLLTMTTEEALEHGVADFRADSVEEVLESLGLAGATVRHASETWAETLVRVLTHPVISSLLMSLGMLGLLIELRSPGFGVPGAVGVAGLGLFFWGHWIVRLAGWEEALLVGAGIVLLAVEAFVTPGFGVAGIVGTTAIVAGLGLSLVGAGATWTTLVIAVGRVAISLLLSLVAGLVLIRLLPRLPPGRRLVLTRKLDAMEAPASAPATDHGLLGRSGRVVSPLRPAGIADIGGERVDVVSDGEFMESGTLVHVVRVDGNRVVVRRAVAPEEGRQK